MEKVRENVRRSAVMSRGRRGLAALVPVQIWLIGVGGQVRSAEIPRPNGPWFYGLMPYHTDT